MKIYRIAGDSEELVEYLYHGTSEGAFRQIRKQGLIPGNWSGYVYFSKDEQYAISYAERKGNPYGNRVLRVTKTNDMVPDDNVQSEGDFKVNRYIPAKDIEVKVQGGWVPIQDYEDESIGILPLDDVPVYFSVSVHEGEVPIREEHGGQFGWIVVEEDVPQFKIREIVKGLYDEGYDNTSILIRRQ